MLIDGFVADETRTWLARCGKRCQVRMAYAQPAGGQVCVLREPLSRVSRRIRSVYLRRAQESFRATVNIG